MSHRESGSCRAAPSIARIVKAPNRIALSIALVGASALGAVHVSAEAGLYTSYTDAQVSVGGSSISPQPQLTEVAGQTVSSSGTAFLTYTLADGSVGSLGTTSGSASASSALGLNRIASNSSLLTNYSGIPPGPSADNPNGTVYATPIGYVDGGGYSRWGDGLTVTGATTGTLVTVVLKGTTSYGLDASSLYLEHYADAYAMSISQQISIFGASASGDLSPFGTKAFIDGSGKIDWSISVSAYTGQQFGIQSIMSVGTNSGNLWENYCYNTDCQQLASFDASHTSLLTEIDLPTGYSIADDSGQIVADGDHFAYQAVLAESQIAPSVPEPATWALLAVGLGLTPFVTRRRAAVKSRLR